jgi:hypothetical protein
MGLVDAIGAALLVRGFASAPLSLLWGARWVAVECAHRPRAAHGTTRLAFRHLSS